MPASPHKLDMETALSILNPSPLFLDGPGLLHDLVSGPESQNDAIEHLDVGGKRTIVSYSLLHRQSARLAKRLIPHLNTTSSRSTIVPVFIPQCPSLYISLLAILKSGAAFCPLNLDVPEERLNFILKDTAASVILTTTKLRTKLAALQNLPVICVDEADSDENDFPQPEHTRCVQKDLILSRSLISYSFATTTSIQTGDLAYVMYTSGSTGLPKAVCLSHRAATQALLAHDAHIPTFSRFLQFASPTFDVSVFEIFFPLFRGSTLVSCERSRLLVDLPGAISELDVDAAELTPSVAASLLRTRKAVPSLRLLLTIGEMLKEQVIREFGDSQSQTGILYGE